MITLQFSSTNQIGALLIQWGTWSWANHVDFVLPDGQLLGAAGIEGGGGVIVRPMHPLKHYKRVERYEVDASDQVIDYALSQVGKPYDWAGVINFITRSRDWMEEDKWFCSELVAWAFEKAGQPLLRGVCYRITPGNLLMSTKLQYTQLPDGIE
jgi:hypothetical protein